MKLPFTERVVNSISGVFGFWKWTTYFSILNLSIKDPPTTAIIRPNTTYATAIFQPKILVKRTRLPKSTIGEEIKKENVTPTGRPAFENPINSGIEEQEQNGVIVPSKAAIQLAVIPLNRPRIFFVRSGVKKLCMYEIIKIKVHNSITIFITSYKKN